MKNLFKKITGAVRSFISSVTPGSNAIKGASYGLILITSILLLLYVVNVIINIRDPWILVLFFVFILMVVLGGLLAVWLLSKVMKIPTIMKKALVISLPLVTVLMNIDGKFLLIYLLIALLLGAAFAVLRWTGFKALNLRKKIVTLLGLVLGLAGAITSIVLYIPSGFEMDEFVNAASLTEVEHIGAKNPGAKGEFTVLELSYGSGKDKHRIEFGEETDIVTDSVDGTPFIDKWDGISGWWREKYWGFDYRALPINGRVWYPEGEGPFPLVLVVHGNHSMQDYSDPGYDYLGELLASRGIILASVDENFINGSWSDIVQSLEKENDARGWLLLEHLRVWHEWNDEEDNPFYGKIDTEKISLIGHSRGGEAVGHAAMMNALPYYPDDASIELNYNFNLKSVIAIAPVDGQYQPGNSRTKFEDVSYFVLHGAQDADVSSYMGSMQYERIKFTDSLYRFKTGLYIYGANHGQFNTSWGNNDTGNPFIGFLNLKQLLPAEEQEQIAEVYISAFLEATLNERYEYLPLFMDARTGSAWLPETTYLNQFEDSQSKFFATFNEDYDVTTASDPNVSIHTSDLNVWKEREIQLKWQEKGSRALFVGWKNAEEDSAQTEFPSLSFSFENPISIDSTQSLVFTMAESTESSDPKSGGKWVKEDENENSDEEEENEDEENAEEENEVEDEEKEEEDGEDEDDEEDEPEAPIDFTIVVVDSTGQELRFPLSTFSALQREIEVRIWKEAFMEDESESEKVFQTFVFHLDRLDVTDSINLDSITEIRFVFDNTEEGVIVIDNLGFMNDLSTYK